MAGKTILFVFLATVFLMPYATTSSRNYPLGNTVNPRASNLATRLHYFMKDGANASTADCWASLAEIRTCSNEIVGFFLNGYTDIDTPCCVAIEVISHHCWPSMLEVFGFTTEEGNMLAAYCNKTPSAAPAGASPRTQA